MKNFLFILVVAICSETIAPGSFFQIFNVAADSSIAKSSKFSKEFSSNNTINLSIGNSHQLEKLKFDCAKLYQNSSRPKIKIFKPDTSLTASMPILKTEPIDRGIFAPGFECIDLDSLD
ncbi:MAG: hypothetical protein U5K72_03985 [Balneolaceae bacterium]|nr:hypothetical protein [Balneolaceae bacterium]